MPKPVVALVGRPNVGKSTFFNRLAGDRLAIVDDVPGTTRDRLFAEAEWNGIVFDMVDTGGIDPSHGGKTPLSIGSADFIQEIRQQALMAVHDADAILFLTDGDSGVTPPDREVAEILRATRRRWTATAGRPSSWWSTSAKTPPAAPKQPSSMNWASATRTPSPPCTVPGPGTC